MLDEVNLGEKHDENGDKVGEHAPALDAVPALIVVVIAIFVQLVADKDQIVLTFLSLQNFTQHFEKKIR